MVYGNGTAGEMNLTELAEEYSQYAYVFPQNTEVQWSYDENNSIDKAEFDVDVDIKEGCIIKFYKAFCHINGTIYLTIHQFLMDTAMNQCEGN